MSVASKTRRRAKRLGRRRALAAFARHGGYVSPDVWQAFQRMAATPGPASAAPVVPGFLAGVPIHVSPMLPPGTIVPMPPMPRTSLFEFSPLAAPAEPNLRFRWYP
jgi:hypothetical protein